MRLRTENTFDIFHGLIWMIAGLTGSGRLSQYCGGPASYPMGYKGLEKLLSDKIFLFAGMPGGRGMGLRDLKKPVSSDMPDSGARTCKGKEAGAGGERRPEEPSEKASRMLEDYGNSILRLAYSYLHNMSDAEDVLQDTLIQYLKHQPHLFGPAHEKAWLLRVAANLSKNKIKYNKIRQADVLEESLAAEERGDLSFVWEAVKNLEYPYREAVHLFYYEGYSVREISSILQRKEATVRSDLRRGREKLRAVLKDAYDFE